MNTKVCNVRWRYAVWATAVVAAAAATACNHEIEQSPEPKNIGFSIGWDAARAVETNAQNLDRIGVFGYSTPSVWDNLLADVYEPDYFLNKMVVRTEPGTWWYDGPKKYWPADPQRRITFFAYAPYIDVQDIFTLKPSGDPASGSPTIEYAPPLDAIRQIDLLWDVQPDRVYEQHNGGTVQFTMQHALTSIAFEAQVADDENHEGAPYTIEVLKVGVRNAVAGGRFDLYTGTWTLDTVSDPSDLADYLLTPEEHKGLNSVRFHCQYDPLTTPGYTDPGAGLVALNKSYAMLMILPQGFRTGDELIAGVSRPTTVFITYRTTNLLTTENSEITREIILASHPVARDWVWQQGTGITYQFTISLFDDVAVKVKTRSFMQDEKWRPGGSDDLGVN